MAFSRSEKIGTIFTRMTSLLRGSVIKEENLPVWYQVYKAFPPKDEPCFNKSAPQKEIQNIFYKEDQLRAKFHGDVSIPPMNLKNQKVTHTQIFFTIHNSLLQTGMEADQAYEKALENYKAIFTKSTMGNPKSPPAPSHAPLNNNPKEKET